MANVGLESWSLNPVLNTFPRYSDPRKNSPSLDVPDPQPPGEGGDGGKKGGWQSSTARGIGWGNYRSGG